METKMERQEGLAIPRGDGWRRGGLAIRGVTYGKTGRVGIRGDTLTQSNTRRNKLTETGF